jgi:hypothetical protein
MKLVIEAETAQELKAKLENLMSLFNVVPVVERSDNVQSDSKKHSDDKVKNHKIESPKDNSTETIEKVVAEPKKKPAAQAGKKTVIEKSNDATFMSKGHINGKLHKDAVTVANPESTPVLAVSKTIAIEALQKVNVEKGFEAAKSVLAEFNVKRFVELPESEYADFVQACQAVE